MPVMHHPERFPTPESTPRILLQRNGTVRVGSLTPSETSGDEDTPPPCYPGNVSGEDLVAVDITSNDVNNETGGLPNTGSHNLGVKLTQCKSMQFSI